MAGTDREAVAVLYKLAMFEEAYQRLRLAVRRKEDPTTSTGELDENQTQLNLSLDSFLLNGRALIEFFHNRRSPKYVRAVDFSTAYAPEDKRDLSKWLGVLNTHLAHIARGRAADGAPQWPEDEIHDLVVRNYVCFLKALPACREQLFPVLSEVTPAYVRQRYLAAFKTT